MAVTVARDTIVCPGCGSQRRVSDRQARMSRTRGGIPCTNCRGISPTRKATESDFRFWLRHFGVDAPRGTPVREFIAAGGAPHELVQLAQEVYPDAIVMQ